MRTKMYLLCLIAVLTSSCSQNEQLQQSAKDGLIGKAAQVVETNPQHAMNLLSSVKIGSLSEGEHAYFTLLDARAREKSGINIGADSEVLKARDYFIQNEDASAAAFACFMAGKVFYARGNNTKAQQQFLLADEWAEKANYNIPNFPSSVIPYNIALFYKKDKKYAESLSYGRKVLSLNQDNPYKMHVLEVIGLDLYYLSQPDSAFYYYDEAFTLANLQNDDLGKQRILHNKAELHRELKQFALAEKEYRQAIALIASNDSINLGYSYITLADMYNQSNRTDSAVYYITQAEKLLVWADNRIKGDLYESLSEIEQKRGNIQKSVFYRERSQDFRNQLVQISKAEQQALQEENEKKQATIDMLVQRDNENYLEMQEAIRKQLVTVGASIILLMAMSCLIRTYQRRIKKNKTKEVNQVNLIDKEVAKQLKESFHLAILDVPIEPDKGTREERSLRKKIREAIINHLLRIHDYELMRDYITDRLLDEDVEDYTIPKE